MPYEKGQKLALKRPFWGHKPGTVGRVSKVHAPTAVNAYTAGIKFRGSPVASVRDKDLDDLLERPPQTESKTRTPLNVKHPTPTEDEKVFRRSRNLSDAGQRVRDALYPEKSMKKPVKENTQPPIKPGVPLPPLTSADAEDQEKKKGAQSGTGFLKKQDTGKPSSKYNRPKSSFKPFWLESPAKTIVATMLEDEYPGIGQPPPEPLASGRVDPDELDIGRDFEMRKAGGDPTQAEAIALGNLAKDPRYYTNLLSGQAVPPAKTYMGSMAGDSMGTAGSSSGGM